MGRKECQGGTHPENGNRRPGQDHDVVSQHDHPHRVLPQRQRRPQKGRSYHPGPRGFHQKGTGVLWSKRIQNRCQRYGTEISRSGQQDRHRSDAQRTHRNLHYALITIQHIILPTTVLKPEPKCKLRFFAFEYRYFFDLILVGFFELPLLAQVFDLCLLILTTLSNRKSYVAASLPVLPWRDDLCP